MTRQRNHTFRQHRTFWSVMLFGAFTAFVVSLIAEIVVISTRSFSVVNMLAYSAIFGSLTLLLWLYNKKIKRAESQAKNAEAALRTQKAAFKKQAKTRTAALHKLQLEEMSYAYRFAELGQFGVVLLHDMANHLTALSLEMDDLPSDRHTKATARIKKIIGSLENTVENTQEQLHGEARTQTFDIAQKVGETVTFLRAKAKKADVAIAWQPPVGSWKYTGDAFSLCQVVTIVANNAIDAYAATKGVKRVGIVMQRDTKNIVIRISDWGKGIAAQDEHNLFKPVHSNKKTGLGLGLYIAKQVIETQFAGTISLNPRCRHTEFIIKLPVESN